MGLQSHEVVCRVGTHSPREGRNAINKHEFISPLWIHTAILGAPTRSHKWSANHLPRMAAGGFSHHYVLKDLFLLFLFMRMCLCECVLCFRVQVSTPVVNERTSAPSSAGRVSCQVVVGSLMWVLGLGEEQYGLSPLNHRPASPSENSEP